MQKRLLSSVEKIYRNRDLIISNLKQLALKVKESKEIREIVLFGSVARGDYGLYSDADILIILENSEKKRFFDRIPEFIDYFLDSPIHVDIFPYTIKEIERMVKANNFFIKRALNEGIKLC